MRVLIARILVDDQAEPPTAVLAVAASDGPGVQTDIDPAALPDVIAAIAAAGGELATRETSGFLDGIRAYLDERIAEQEQRLRDLKAARDRWPTEPTGQPA